MKSFEYARAYATEQAVGLVAGRPDATFVAGGTDLLNLMKDDVQAHGRIVDLNDLPLTEIASSRGHARVGGLARLADVAGHPLVRDRFPVVAQALLATASPQVRNMATVGGNLLQRTRCGYFRDPGSACNKRAPGSGCPALDGWNRGHALFGGSTHCIAVHPSDLAVALLAVDAVVLTQGPGGQRRIPVGEFHLLPGTTPERENVLDHGEVVLGIEMPFSAFAARSAYLKLRDRATFEFTVVSVAAALDMRGRTVRDVRLAFGGVATKAWRSPAAEAALRGRVLDARAIEAASQAAVDGAAPRTHNQFKVELLRRALGRVLRDLGGER